MNHSDYFTVGTRNPHARPQATFWKAAETAPLWLVDIIRDTLHDHGSMFPSDGMWWLASEIVDLLLEEGATYRADIVPVVDQWASCIATGKVADWYGSAWPVSAAFVQEYCDEFGSSGSVEGDILGGLVVAGIRFGDAFLLHHGTVEP